MFSALFSFLGGSVFRMIWGEVSAFVKAREDHKFEIERMQLVGQQEAAQHARNLESIRLQADLGVKVIAAQREADMERLDGQGWLAAVQDVGKPTGILWLDVWNGAVRPLLATLAILVVVAEVIVAGFVISEWTRELLGAILGIYVADRSLAKRGK